MAVIEPLPHLAGAAQPGSLLPFQSITYGDHLLSKTENNFDFSETQPKL